MNARERGLAALSKNAVSPIPVDVYLNAIYPRLETALCRHFGLSPAEHEVLMQRLGRVMRFGRPAYIGPPLPETFDFGPPRSDPSQRGQNGRRGD